MQLGKSSEIKVTPREAERLFKKVLSEFGVLLDFKVVQGNDPASFIWGRVTLPSWYLTKPKNIVLQTLRHEVGHRTVFPGKPDWEKLVMHIAMEKQLDPGTFVNVVADWFVDYELLKKYGEEYYARIVDAVKGYNGKDPRFWIMACAYYFMAKQLGINTPDILSKAKKLVKDEVIETAKEAFKIVTSSNSYETKIIQLAELLKSYFNFFMKRVYEEKPQRYRRNYVPPLRKISPFMPLPQNLSQNDPKNPVRDPTWLIQMLAMHAEYVESKYRPGVPQFLIELGIGDTGEVRFIKNEIAIEVTRLKFYSRYVEAVERVGTSGSKVEELEQWTIGDLPYELRVEETLRIYGEVLPPVFSLKFSTREDPEAGGRGGSVIIIIDCSGSMGTFAMKQAKQAAFAILQEARKRGDEVYLIFFSGNAVPLPPGRNYDIYEKAIVSVIAHGGTVLPKALIYALEYARLSGRATTFIISDAGTSEVSISASMMQELRKYGKVVFFWIGGAYGEYAKQWLRESEAKVYLLPRRKDFTEDALREAIW